MVVPWTVLPPSPWMTFTVHTFPSWHWHELPVQGYGSSSVHRSAGTHTGTVSVDFWGPSTSDRTPQ
jgi:hypothetical protein